MHVCFLLLRVFISRAERLDFLPALLKRWPSYFVLSVQTKKKKLKSVIEHISSLSLPNRVTIIVKPLENKDNTFYVNTLRNLAITSIRTSHFIVLDMDLWPLPNLFEQLQLLPPSLLNSTSSAGIIPAFFLKSSEISSAFL